MHKTVKLLWVPDLAQVEISVQELQNQDVKHSLHLKLPHKAPWQGLIKKGKWQMKQQRPLPLDTWPVHTVTGHTLWQEPFCRLAYHKAMQHCSKRMLARHPEPCLYPKGAPVRGPGNPIHLGCGVPAKFIKARRTDV